MKIAIIHDDFSICGGGEKLVSLLAEGLNKKGFQMDIYTFDLGSETKKMIPKGINITVLNKEKSSYSAEENEKRFLFSQVKLANEYDFFIFSGHASLCAAKNNKPNLLYCHNVLEAEISNGFNNYYFHSELQKINNTLIERIWNAFYVFKNKFIKAKLPESIANKIDAFRFLVAHKFQLSRLKFAFSYSGQLENLKHIERIAVNSNNIKNKVKKYYSRESTVIYPPVETGEYRHKKSKNYWVSVNRITPPKRIELQLTAFARIPSENLLIIGDIQDKAYYDKLKAITPVNVKFLGVIINQELADKLSECKGMIFTAKDEDFGMSVVEAMASGKPVIAPNEGGPKETVVNGQTGILISNIDAKKLAQAVKNLDAELKKNQDKYKEACITQAKRFDVEAFISQIVRQIT